ncbi:MAG TPA: ABC transporter permease [Streptosporangiaceae bacterium]|nr:ABC transporter permease [Streptosporangiaceae bacterium]
MTRQKTGFEGTAELVRLAFRRDIVMLPACAVGIAALLALTARDLRVLYPSAATRRAVAAHAGANPALRLLLGQLDGSSIGAFLAARWSVWGAVLAVLLTVFVVVRHTRADEEAGRFELVGAAAVGRRAPLTAALFPVVAANLVIAGLTCWWLPAQKLPWAGTAALALSIGECGLVFAGVAALGAQLAETARGARGIAIGTLGAAFVLRGVGDAGPQGLSWLSWASPLGWVEQVRAFGSAGERWWVPALPLAAFAGLVAASFALAARRDGSAALLPARPGRPSASALLRGPLGLAWRLQRGSLAAWLAGYAFVFAAFGAAASGIGSILGASVPLRRYLLRIGHQAVVVDAFMSALMLLAILGTAAYATAAVLRLRTEETGNLAEPVLATAAGRIRWGLSHLSVAMVGGGLLVVVAGLSAGLGYGLLTGAVATEVPSVLAAALAKLPAALVLAALAIALVGLLPWESVAVAWTAVALAAVLAVFGPALGWPAWLTDISPVTQTPRLPGGTVAAQPLLWLCGIAVGLSVVGLIGLRRRDIGDFGPARLVFIVRAWLLEYVRESQGLSRSGSGASPAKPPGPP